MTRINKSFVAFIIGIFFCANISSCMGGFVKSAMDSTVDSTKFGGQLLLHKNPKVGDFAVHVAQDQSRMNMMGKEMVIDVEREVTTTIFSIKDGLVGIRMTTKILKHSATMDGQPQNMPGPDAAANSGRTDFYTDMNGIIKDGYVINEAYGINKKITVAQPGDSEYVTYTKLDQKEKINLSGVGKYATTSQYCVKSNQFNANLIVAQMDTDSKQYVVEYVSPDVKFLSVMSQNIMMTNAKFDLATEVKVLKSFVTLLSYTTFFMNPASLAANLSSGKVLDFAKSFAAPGKQGLLDSFLGTSSDLVKQFNTNAKGISLTRLVAQGNKKI